MKKMIIAVAAVLAFSAIPLVSFAASPHGGHGDHQGDVAHEEVVEGVKVTFKVMSMKEHLKAIGQEMPKGMKETHHISAEFKDVKSGKALTEGEVKVKVQSPNKTDQTKDMIGMQGHFGADLEMSKKGKYGVMSKFLLKDGKTRSAKFWYTVK